MDNNIPRITASEVDGNVSYYIVKKCIDCAIVRPDDAVEVLEMQFPTLESATAMSRGFIEITLKKHSGAEFKDGVLYLVNDEGDTHRYIQAIITGTPTIVWQSTDEAIANQEITNKFNDIMTGVEFDSPTE
jgi:hypothetical protein